MSGTVAASAASLMVSTPRALRVLARLLLALGALLALALGLVPWQQTASGSGRVVAFAPLERQQQVDAPLEGRVTRWLVREGSRVKRGELLLELTDNDPDILARLEQERLAVVARRDATVARASAIVARQQTLALSRTSAISAARHRVAMAQQRVRAAEQAQQAARSAQQATELNLTRQTRLLEQGLTSQRSLELAQLEAVRARTDVDRADASHQAAEGEALALGADQARIEHDLNAAIDDARGAEATALAEEANIAAELARLEVRLARQSTMELRAPMDGTVLRLLSGQGNAFVKAGEPLVTVVPDTSERAVELWVDGNDLPLLSEGRPVRLQFEGWPAVQFTGWPSVAVGTFGGQVSLIDAADDGNGRFRILVRPLGDEPWPSGQYLRQGVRANAWVLLDQVSMGYELWRRFNGFPQTVKPTSPATPKLEAK